MSIIRRISPEENVIAIDGKPANVLQLNTNHVFTFEGRAINGVKSSFRTAVKTQGLKISVFVTCGIPLPAF